MRSMTNPKSAIGFVVMTFLCGHLLAQTQKQPFWDCPSPNPNVLRVRVSERFTNTLADRKILPDISDLKGQKPGSVVVVQFEVSPTGDVTCTRPVTGNRDLFRRSQEAVLK